MVGPGSLTYHSSVSAPTPPRRRPAARYRWDYPSTSTASFCRRPLSPEKAIRPSRIERFVRNWGGNGRRGCAGQRQICTVHAPDDHSLFKVCSSVCPQHPYRLCTGKAGFLSRLLPRLSDWYPQPCPTAIKRLSTSCPQAYPRLLNSLL